MGKDGVQEVKTALRFYEKQEKCKFVGIVMTNAKEFTKGAVGLAKDNNIKLKSRKFLEKILKDYPVEKYSF